MKHKLTPKRQKVATAINRRVYEIIKSHGPHWSVYHHAELLEFIPSVLRKHRISRRERVVVFLRYANIKSVRARFMKTGIIQPYAETRKQGLAFLLNH